MDWWQIVWIVWFFWMCYNIVDDLTKMVVGAAEYKYGTMMLRGVMTTAWLVILFINFSHVWGMSIFEAIIYLGTFEG